MAAHGRNMEALSCLWRLEMGIWDPNATVKILLQVLFDNGLVPSFWNSHFSALRSTLEAGVPTARNKLGGHGQGSQVVELPEYIVAYVIHLTASAIVFLSDAEAALP